MQVYPLAVHLNGIAVDHRGRTGDVGKGRGGEQAEGDGEGAHGYSLPWLGENESPAVSAFRRLGNGLALVLAQRLDRKSRPPHVRLGHSATVHPGRRSVP